MRTNRVIRAIVATALLGPAAHAQEMWTLDAGIFGRVNWLNSSYETNTGFGGGARLGMFVWKQLEVEVDASYRRTAGSPVRASARSTTSR